MGLDILNDVKIAECKINFSLFVASINCFKIEVECKAEIVKIDVELVLKVSDVNWLD